MALHLHQSQILLCLCWMICLLTLREVYGNKKKTQKHKATAQSKVGMAISCCVLSSKSPTSHGSHAVKSHSFSHDDCTEQIKRAGICTSRFLILKLNREQFVTEGLAEPNVEAPLCQFTPTPYRHTET